MELITKVDDFYKVCRTCLLNKTEMLSVKSLEDLISSLGIKMDGNVLLPKLICLDCTQLIEKFTEFKQQCEKSEELLLQILNNNENNKLQDEKENLLNLNNIEISIDDDNTHYDQVENIEANDLSSNDEEKLSFSNLATKVEIKNSDSEQILDDFELKSEKLHSDDKKNVKYLNGTVTCKICKKRITRKSIYIHMRYHKPKKHICDICSSAFRQPNELARHRLRVHQVQESVTCHVCNAVFQLQVQLDFHMKRHFHKKSVCHICGKTYFNSAKLARHKQIHESREKTIFCLLCDSMFSRQSSLLFHQKIYHSGAPPQKKVCNICGKSVVNLRGHTKQKHSNERPFKCEQCENSYVYKHQLFRHVKDIHERTEQKKNVALCSTCGKGFKSKADLKTHMLSHSDLLPFECTMCDKKYKSATGLRYHLRIHNDLRPFQCSHCSKAFTSMNVLKNHLRTHTGERPFACQVCGRAFTQKSALKTHLRGVHGF